MGLLDAISAGGTVEEWLPATANSEGGDELEYSAHDRSAVGGWWKIHGFGSPGFLPGSRIGLQMKLVGWNQVAVFGEWTRTERQRW